MGLLNENVSLTLKIQIPNVLNFTISRVQQFCPSQAIARTLCGSYAHPVLWVCSLPSPVWLIPICFPTSSSGLTSCMGPSLTLPGEVRPYSQHCRGDCHTVFSLSCPFVPLSRALLGHCGCVVICLLGTEHNFWGIMSLPWKFGEAFNQLHSSSFCPLTPGGCVLQPRQPHVTLS